MPPSFAVQLAVPILRDFRRLSTEVDIDLISPYGVGPPLGDVDVAVVYPRPTVSDLVTDLLWPVRLSILCHPNIAAAHRGKDLAAFIEANEIVHVRIADLPRHQFWSQFVRQNNLAGVNIARGLVFDTAVLAVRYALGGVGLALVDTNLFAEEISAGRLVKPFEVTLDDGYGYYLITHPEGLGDTAIALFRSWLIERFGTQTVSASPPVQLAVSNE
jgi:DNA-binding transcriptional LysR family regulator